jgi:hypothetical protein
MGGIRKLRPVAQLDQHPDVIEAAINHYRRPDNGTKCPTWVYLRGMDIYCLHEFFRTNELWENDPTAELVGVYAGRKVLAQISEDIRVLQHEHGLDVAPPALQPPADVIPFPQVSTHGKAHRQKAKRSEGQSVRGSGSQLSG